MKKCCENWGVCLTFRCVHKPSGNGIVERNHRIIKRMCARLQNSVEYCVYWYNITPHGEIKVVPALRLFRYKWRNPFFEQKTALHDRLNDDACVNCVFSVGDLVWVKPPGGRCTSKWGCGKVTKINSRYNVEIDGLPRHVCDARRRVENEIDTRVRLARFAVVPLLASPEELPEDAMGAEPSGIEGPQLSGPENINDGVSASSRQNRSRSGHQLI